MQGNLFLNIHLKYNFDLPFFNFIIDIKNENENI